MCGIAGVVGAHPFQSQLETLAARMAAQLKHRGPDGAAYYADSNVLLVHTRLSIIDLGGGAQPIHNENKTIWISFNGEIFNYIELRKRLLDKGHHFYTQTDTEVIVHLYEEYGENCLQYLNGQFAFAIWDAVQQKCFLARDRVGIAPLYYKQEGGWIAFGSELKALMETQEGPPEIDPRALDEILTFWCTLPSRTPFKHCYALPPGSYAVFANGTFTLHQYWDYDFPVEAGDFITNEQEASETIQELLTDATRIRLRADVPVGAYLSGGLDSSILTSLIKKQNDVTLSTFSISFAEADHDEQPYQKRMVDYLQTDHKSIHCENSDIGQCFEDSIWHIEHPIIRTAPIPMGMLSGLAHQQNFKVVLTGEGADEVFGGYDIFKEAKIRYFWGVNPNSEFRPGLLEKLYPYLQLQQKNANAFTRRFYGVGVTDRNQPLFSHLTRVSSTSKIKHFFNDGIGGVDNQKACEELISLLPADFHKWNWLCKAQYLEMKTLMGSYLLTSQGDRMLMKNSVEGRFPFLDHRLIEYAARLHPRLKMRVLREKHVLRSAMKNVLPVDIANRTKQPYRAPNIPSFFGDSTPEFVNNLLSSEAISESGIFDDKKVQLLAKKARAGRGIGYSDNMAVVFILSTQLIHQNFISRFGANFGVDSKKVIEPIARIS